MVQKQATSKRKPVARARGGRGGPISAPPPPPPKEVIFATTSSSSGIDNDSNCQYSGEAASTAQFLSITEQQRLLNNFTVALGPVLEADNFADLLQEIKQALFERDFAGAFGREDYLDAYAARWSPTRALCYAAIFRRHLPRHLKASAAASSSSSSPPGHIKMICIGGCAAEHVAFASYLQSQSSSSPHSGSLTLLDSAAWSSVSTKFQNTLTSPLPLSKYASAAIRDSNTPVLATPEQLNLQVLQQDALQATEAQWAEILTPENTATTTTTVVATLFFTLNELYAEGGITQTTRFLKALEASLPDQALLLVVDSPGSYSEAALGKDKKNYPMQWLLHHSLTDMESTAQHWTRLESHDSLWFRLSEQLKYPIPLEHMRYQLHLYRIDKTPKS